LICSNIAGRDRAYPAKPFSTYRDGCRGGS